MARRKTLEVPAHVVPFQRTPEEWADLGAPAWVYDLDAGAEALCAWAVMRYGGGVDPTERLLRWFVSRLWWRGCVQPQYLDAADALTDVERGMWVAPCSTRGRPGQRAAPMLRADAPVPAWLGCCRQPERRNPDE